MENKSQIVLKLTQAAFMTALCYIGFQFLRIDIPVGTEKTAFHLGNVCCVLGALLLGGLWGGLSGAIGMTIADLTSGYATSAPKTFVLKLCIGLIVGLVAHGIGKLSKQKDKKQIFKWALIGSIAGMAFNVVADPVVGYFYKMYIMGIPQEVSSVFAKMASVTTFVNAIITVIVTVVLYVALRPAMGKAGMLPTIGK